MNMRVAYHKQLINIIIMPFFNSFLVRSRVVHEHRRLVDARTQKINLYS
jgi:hypothetical protein